MIQQQFSFTEFGFSSQIIRDLVDVKEGIVPFINAPFSIDNLKKQAELVQFSQKQRAVLVAAMKNQNKAISISNNTANNIAALQNGNTVTITTGHQLNLFAGPLYSIYKVAQIIALCKEMNRQDTVHKYVPVFWMATEDHDFEEINHIHLFGNKIGWHKKGQTNRIAGAIEPAEIREFTNAIIDKYREEEIKNEIEKFAKIYDEAPNLAEATRQLMNKLFGEFGLVIIDGNEADLKKAFIPVVEKELKESFVFNNVSQTNKKLDLAGYHSQVFLRNCNLFHINEDGLRERISKTDDKFFIGEKEVSITEMLEEVQLYPQRYSPNALLRPVYQELILPNIAYIGGGGEIAYWLQLKTVFEALQLRFPLLRVRDSIVLLRNKDIEEIEKLQLSLPKLKSNLHDLVKEIAIEDTKINIQLHQEIDNLEGIKKEVLEKALTVNNGLAGMVEAEFAKIKSGLERIESKLIKAEKAKHGQKAKKIEKLQHKIYPKGGFQERYENFLAYYLVDSTFISKIVDNLKAADQPKIHIVEI